MMKEWFPCEGGALLDFMLGKTVAATENSDWETVVTFTDGSMARCTALSGARYSSMSEDSPTVQWEICP